MGVRVYEILPGQLFQSARWDKLSEAQMRTLVIRHGIVTVVALHRTGARALQALVRHYYHWPIPDGQEVPYDLLRSRICTLPLSEGPILTMCYGGRNRSGLLSALIIQHLLDCSGAEALQHVRAVRHGALRNQHFAAYLQSANKEACNGQLF